MAQVNLNIESLEQTLSTFVSSHDTLETTTSTMNSTLASTEWQSPAAEAFRNSWDSDYYPTLKRIMDAVDQFNVDIRNQLDRYRQNEGLG